MASSNVYMKLKQIQDIKSKAGFLRVFIPGENDKVYNARFIAFLFSISITSESFFCLELGSKEKHGEILVLKKYKDLHLYINEDENFSRLIMYNCSPIDIDKIVWGYNEYCY